MNATIDEGMDIDSCIESSGAAAGNLPAMDLVGPLSILGGAGHSNSQLPKIDENNVLADDCTNVRRFVTKLDQLDDQIEKLRKEALLLQDKRDGLLTELDVIRSNQILANLNEYEDEQINCYVQRLSNRLATIELSVKIVRDAAQEDSLHEINRLIDTLITSTDRLLSRQRCQSFLNCFVDSHVSDWNEPLTSTSTSSACSTVCEQEQLVDKTFQTCLNGCTLDDQKQIRKRIIALSIYLNKQTISD